MAIDIKHFSRVQPGSEDEARLHDHTGLPAIRRTVIRDLGHRLNALLEPLGYDRDGNEWRKRSWTGRTLVLINRDKFGYSCGIGVGALPRLRLGQSSPAGTPDGFPIVAMGRFYRDLPNTCEFDWIHYRKLHDNPDSMAALLDLVRLRVIPWLETRHQPGALFRMPEPEAMAAIKAR